MQNIINISNKFFKLNNIKINRTKSELIALRPRMNALIPEGIWIGTPPKYIEAKNVEESIRFLGILINFKSQEKVSIGYYKKVVSSITSILKIKKLLVN